MTMRTPKIRHNKKELPNLVKSAIIILNKYNKIIFYLLYLKE